VKTQTWRRALIISLACGPVVLCFLASWQPWLTDPNTLATLIFLELILAALWSYRSRFFPLLLGAFLCAGIMFSFSGAFRTGRWLVLAVAAAAGVIVYMKQRQLHLTVFHSLAWVCVVTALASAVVSAYPQVAVLKALSLLLLFLYGATGARLAMLGHEHAFLSSFMAGCEWVVYLAAIAYFLFEFPIFGNPNSLGAVMGVVAVPMLFWGILVNEPSPRRSRYTAALVVALILLFTSYARAGFAAAACTCVLMCLTLRRYRLLAKGVCLCLLLAAAVAAIVPQYNEPSGSLTSTFLYKGKREQGIFGSRKSIWDHTVAVIREHPWLGSGFGTSTTSYEDDSRELAAVQSSVQASREHGNSYLAITEWVGLLGDAPFLCLLLLIVLNLSRVLVWVRRSGSVSSPAVPVAMVVLAGLVHAAFEDWLFAVGYYLCVLFWTFAFILVDLVPPPFPSCVPAAQNVPRHWPGHSPALIPARHAPVS